VPYDFPEEGFSMMLELAGIGACIFMIDKLWDKDRRAVKRKWRQIMRGVGAKNKMEQTYEILKIIQKQYGFDMLISLPKGLSYEELEKLIPKIETGLGCVSEMEWKRFKNCAYLKTAMTEYDEKKKFQPVPTAGPWEMYFGETYFLEQLKADMRDYPHVLYAGSTGTGKTRGIFIAVTNLLYWYDDVELYLAQVSDKKDLQKFAHYKQTQYFAQNLQTTDQLLKHLLQEQQRRNKLLNQYDMNNIDEYNKRFKDNPIKYSYLVFDEAASLMPGDSKDVDPNYTIKKRIIFNLNELQRQARSAGMFIVSSLQRPDKNNLDPNTKNLFNIKVAFRANNIASSKVLTDDDSVYNLPNREALFMGSTQKTLKTPYIDDVLIRQLLQDKYEKDHKYINIFPEELEAPENKVVSFEGKKQKPKSKGVVKKC
jgi:S-DNA-T family DNA segregation ATPase FtsK/SpoIIIE